LKYYKKPSDNINPNTTMYEITVSDKDGTVKGINVLPQPVSIIKNFAKKSGLIKYYIKVDNTPIEYTVKIIDDDYNSENENLGGWSKLKFYHKVNDIYLR
ncbi:MAG: hypothetical protein U9Q67_03425, partial [Patescibacteria group bacterium]|nr:hypothetical protein [Patescibacteria group bacterium]